MSESSFPFEGQAVAPAPLESEPIGPSGNRTKLLAVGGVAAVVVLGMVAYFVVFAGGGGADDKPPAAAGEPVVGTAVPAEDPVTTVPVRDRVSAKSFGHNPFKALVVPPAPGAGEAATEGAPVIAPVTAPITAPAGSTTGGTTTGGSTTPVTSTPAQSMSHTFRVVSASADNSRITVKVDGVTYRDLEAGEVFATYFKVRLISGRSNSFQFGEERFNVLGRKTLTIA